MFPFTYKATGADVAMWREYGALRYQESRRIGSPDQRHAGDVTVPSASRSPETDVDVVGVAGEHALAIFLGLQDWLPTVNTFKSVPDVGGYEVRCGSRHSYRLVVRPRDSLEAEIRAGDG